MADRYASLKQGLVGCWIPSVSGSGLLLPDLSGRGNNGSLVNMDASDWVSSQYGRALDFDGIDDYVSIPHKNEYGTLSTGGTICLWFRTTTTGVLQDIISKPSFNNFEFRIRSDTNKLQLLVSGVVNQIGNAVIATNTWYAVAITFKANESICYLNGAVDFTAAFSIVDNTSDINIGRRLQFTDFHFQGQMNDIRIYNRALTEPEIRLLASEPGIGFKPAKKLSRFSQRFTYNPPKARNYGVVRVKETDYATLRQGLVGAWCPSLPNGGSGNTLPDVSGFNNHGSLVNMSPDDWVSGQYGRALDFDGVNDEARATAPKITDAYCVSVWVKATTGAGSGLIALSQDGSNLGADLYINANGTIVFYCPSTDNGSSRSFFTTTSSITSNQWVHVVGRWRASLINDIYVDGVSAAGTLTGSVQGALTNRTILSLGSRQGVNSWLTGQLDDARCYNRLLTEPEIKLLASRPGIGLRQESHRQTFYQFPSGARRKRILTGMP